MRFAPPTPATSDIEVTTLAGIRERGGPREFLTPQRLDFDLLMRIESGAVDHTVDFTLHHLGPGELLWVRAGQVHEWGRIEDIEGVVVMFGPHTLHDRTRELIASQEVRPRNLWRAGDLVASPVPAALDLLVSFAEQDPADRGALHEAALGHCLAALLARLALVRTTGTTPVVPPTHEAFGWFRDLLEQRFRTWHQVGDYAQRLGYSARTLNRLARQNTGLSAKQFIDERVVLEAKRQLSHADASVAEIAAQLGFDDASNFSSYFRTRTGTTPAAFRTSSRGVRGR